MTRNGAKIDAALEVIAAAFNRSIQPGEITGTLVDQGGDLEVEVTLRVKRRVTMGQGARIRARAMAMLAIEPWRDRCPKTVKNRGPFAISKHKGCSNKVAAVIVCRGYEDEVGPLRPGEHRRMLPSERLHFVCSHHAEASGPDVIAVVTLEKTHLRTLRAKRQRESDEHAARERQKERELEAELRTLSDEDLRRRLGEFVASHRWGAEDACDRELRRRAQSAQKASAK